MFRVLVFSSTINNKQECPDDLRVTPTINLFGGKKNMAYKRENLHMGVAPHNLMLK